MNIKVSRDWMLSLDGYEVFTLSEGVMKRQDFSLLSVLPFAARVPAGTVATYVVAIGNLPSGLKTSVLVPSQRHLPGGCGFSLTGTFVAASSWEVRATIGCENVTLNSGAICASLSGEQRNTSNAPA